MTVLFRTLKSCLALPRVAWAFPRAAGRALRSWGFPEGLEASKMELDIQCQEFDASKWKELVSTLNQHKTIRLDDCGLGVSHCEDLSSLLSTSQALTELNLSNNELGDSGVDVLCKGLLNPNCNLQKLWLRNCNLTKACCENLRSVLKSKSSLTELHLGDNSLGTLGGKALCQGLMDPNCQLQSLQLQYCELTKENIEALSSVLLTKSSLQTLNLSNNKLGDAAVKHLCQALLDGPCNLQSLQLESCDITHASCKDLSAVLSNKPSLIEFCIGENRIGDAGIAILCQGVQNPNCKIEKLWLWECNITAPGCKELAKVIGTKETLKEISLLGNALTDEGMEFLCQGLKDPKTKLESLWLRDCDLTAACCKSISSALSVNSVLKELQMSGNCIGDEGVIDICEGVRSPNCKLESLWLGQSSLTAVCCEALAKVIVEKPSLLELDVSYSHIGDEGVFKLCEAVKNPNCNLKYLILYDTYWTSQADKELKALEGLKPEFQVVT
ncbi:ribonuclease inhibitor-like isoform X1 [Python bivittatus]|uniref:Ribonuclease inhibitor n=2 Tax=Python bivittatus TaxID=176946 RepID=A0A9F2RBE4_PYTBI|nr:ribonuclease inhibitor-like isoform X1 [Python bivittatus]